MSATATFSVDDYRALEAEVARLRSALVDERAYAEMYDHRVRYGGEPTEQEREEARAALVAEGLLPANEQPTA